MERLCSSSAGNFASTFTRMLPATACLLTLVKNAVEHDAGNVRYRRCSAINWRGTAGGFLSRHCGVAGVILTDSCSVPGHVIAWDDADSPAAGDERRWCRRTLPVQACDAASGNRDRRRVFKRQCRLSAPIWPRLKPMLNQVGWPAPSSRGLENDHHGAGSHVGFPTVVLPSSYIALDRHNAGTQRPDLVPGVSLIPPGGRSVAEWTNRAAFANPAENSVQRRAICCRAGNLAD